ncbi:hypothetical protein [Leptospira andrefontaineae]|uniref:Uncharacterized protein n=1 Tax=Leptospira andrefontaineae TaxID=2484976 RepID=A0A4R9H870_9LEPT|nr:hypothetical protein [Leptospira andrefontaineae]TGK42211.1 hypothetical protein EHO65_05465 [Leptospira andrefontaineae]
MADDFTIDEGEGFPAGNGEDFDPSEMSLDEIDSLLASDGDSSDFNFDSVPGDSPDSEGFEELLASSGDDYPDDIPSFEPEETDFGSDLSQLDESVHLDEDFDFELTDPMIDAEIDRLLDIDDDLNSPPTSSSSAPSWKESSPSSSPENHEDAFGDLGSLDLGDFSQPGDVPSSAFHSDDQPFDWGGDSSDQDEVVGLSDADLDDEAPISLSDDELHNIDIGSNLADFSMDDEEVSAPEDSGSKTFEDEIVSDDEGPISLSEHELDDIMAEDFSPNMEEEGFGDLGGDDISMPSSELTEDINFEGEEEENIALSTDELDHLLEGDGDSSENKSSFDEMGDFGDLDLGSVAEEHTSSDLDMEEEEANEPIALSDDELGNLLSSGDEDEIESIQLDDLDSVGAPTAESEFGMEEGGDSSSELDLSDFNFDSEPDGPKDEFGGEEESISLPVSDFDNFGMSEEENPLDTGLDLGDFEDSAKSEEKAFEETLGDFTSASDEDILGSSDSDLMDFSPTETSEKDFFSENSDPDEAIALSDDELGNLLSSGTEEEEEHTGTSLDLSSDLDDNEPIALSDDELGNLLSGEEETVSSLDSEEDEPIALSDDELGDLLSSGEEEASDADIFADAPPLEHDDAAPIEFGDFSLDSEADEPIALSEDELGHLLEEEPEVETASSDLMEDSDEPISLPINELDDIGTPDVSSDYDIDWDGPVADLNDLSAGEENAVAAPSDWDLGEEADEPITLSNDELGNLLSDETPEGVNSEDLDSLLSSPPEANDLNALGSFEDDIQISGLDFADDVGGEIIPTIEKLAPEPELNFILDEYADENELSPIEEIRNAGAAAEESETGEAIPTQDEMKRILLYLDELLGNLPDDMIRDFSRSDYFELYKKLMKQIGV